MATTSAMFSPETSLLMQKAERVLESSARNRAGIRGPSSGLSQPSFADSLVGGGSSSGSGSSQQGLGSSRSPPGGGGGGGTSRGSARSTDEILAKARALVAAVDGGGGSSATSTATTATASGILGGGGGDVSYASRFASPIRTRVAGGYAPVTATMSPDTMSLMQKAERVLAASASHRSQLQRGALAGGSMNASGLNNPFDQVGTPSNLRTPLRESGLGRPTGGSGLGGEGRGDIGGRGGGDGGGGGGRGGGARGVSPIAALGDSTTTHAGGGVSTPFANFYCLVDSEGLGRDVDDSRGGSGGQGFGANNNDSTAELAALRARVAELEDSLDLKARSGASGPVSGGSPPPPPPSSSSSSSPLPPLPPPSSSTLSSSQAQPPLQNPQPPMSSLATSSSSSSSSSSGLSAVDLEALLDRKLEGFLASLGRALDARFAGVDDRLSKFEARLASLENK